MSVSSKWLLGPANRFVRPLHIKCLHAVVAVQEDCKTVFFIPAVHNPRSALIQEKQLLISDVAIVSYNLVN